MLLVQYDTEKLLPQISRADVKIVIKFVIFVLNVGIRKSEVRCRNSKVGYRKSDIETQRLEVGCRNSKVGYRNSEVGGKYK